MDKDGNPVGVRVYNRKDFEKTLVIVNAPTPLQKKFLNFLKVMTAMQKQLFFVLTLTMQNGCVLLCSDTTQT